MESVIENRTVRPMDEDDIPVVQSILRDLTEAQLARHLEQPDHYGIVTLDETGEIVGALLFVLLDRVVAIRTFGVRPQTRRQRFGTRLIEAIKRELGPLRRRTLSVNVPETRVAAQIMLRRCGFRWYKTIGKRGEDHYVMIYGA